VASGFSEGPACEAGGVTAWEGGARARRARMLATRRLSGAITRNRDGAALLGRAVRAGGGIANMFPWDRGPRISPGQRH
jgi:hypothetical protein